MVQIKGVNATGASVNIKSKDQRLLTISAEEPLKQYYAKQEAAYIAYGEVTFTVGTESDLIYLKNNDTVIGGRNMIITSFDMFLGTSTGGSGDAQLTFYKNPTTAPSTVPAIVSNSNFGSSKTVSLDAYKGDGSTKVLGSAGINLPIQITSQPVYKFDSTTVLPLGTSIGFTFKPPTGNTSMKVNFLISFFMEEVPANVSI